MKFKAILSSFVLFQLAQANAQSNVQSLDKLASINVHLEYNLDTFIEKVNQNGTNRLDYFLSLPKNLAYVKLCDKSLKNIHQNCVLLNDLGFANKDQNVSYRSFADVKKDYQHPNLQIQVEGLPTNYTSEQNIDIKKIYLSGLSKKILPENAALVFIPVELASKQKWVEKFRLTKANELVKQEPDDNNLAKKLTLEYKSLFDKMVVVDLFSTELHKDIQISKNLKMRLAFTGFDRKYQLFNPPLMAFQSRIRQQLFDKDQNTVKDYLAFTVAYNLTRFHPAWGSLVELLNIEKEKQIIQDLNKNENIASLKKDPIFAEVQKDSTAGLANKYIVQAAELKLEIADRERTAELEAQGSQTQYNNANVNISIPSSRELYSSSQLSYQEKLARYNYYSKVTNDTINVINGAASAGQSFLDSILR